LLLTSLSISTCYFLL
jgi:large subunit ribosomal protein L7e